MLVLFERFAYITEDNYTFLKGMVMVRRIAVAELLCVAVLMTGCGLVQQPVDVVSEPYLLDTGLVSRSICFENPTGAPGQ